MKLQIQTMLWVLLEGSVLRILKACATTGPHYLQNDFEK